MSSLATAARLARGDFVRFLHPAWGAEERDTVYSWLAGASYPEARAELEDAFSRRLGGEVNTTTTSSGRAAIEMALRSLDLPTGSEVAIPSFSCSALGAAVLQARLAPLLVDVDDQLNIDAESLSAAWSPAVRVVIVPHLGGVQARSTARIAELAAERGAILIEDAAHSLTLRVNDRQCGTWAPASIFSTGVGKPLFGPGGGMLVLPQPPMIRPGSGRLPDEPRPYVERRVRAFLRTYFPSRRERFDRLVRAARAVASGPAEGMAHFGFTSWSISDIEAKVATLQLTRIDATVGARRLNAARWRALLDGLPFTVAPQDHNTATKLWVRGETPKVASALRAALWAEGVECESLYTPLHLREPFTRSRRSATTMTDSVWQCVFSLPARSDLEDDTWERAERAVDRLSDLRP